MIRERICRFLSDYLSYLSETSVHSHTRSAQLDEKIYLKLQVCLCERIRDSCIDVQIEAIKAAAWLQTPNERYCPTINSFVSLLRHESFSMINLTVLDSLAINSTTFCLLCGELLYHSDKQVRQKVISILEKKVPNKYINALLKRKLIECLLRDKNIDLMESLLDKWLEDTKGDKQVFSFLEAMNIDNIWFRANCVEESLNNDELLSSSQLNLTEETNTKLYKFFSLAFVKLPLRALLGELKSALNTISHKGLFDDFNLILYVNMACRYIVDNIDSKFSLECIIDDSRDYLNALVEHIVKFNLESERKTKSTYFCIYYALNTLRILCKHDDTTKIESDKSLLVEYFEKIYETLKAESNNYFVFEILASFLNLSQMRSFLISQIVKVQLEQNQYLESNESVEMRRMLCLICAYLGRMDSTSDLIMSDDSISFSNVQIEALVQNESNNSRNEPEMNKRFVSYLIKSCIPACLKHEDTYVNVLSIRALGLACLLDQLFAESFLSLFVAVFNIFCLLVFCFLFLLKLYFSFEFAANCFFSFFILNLHKAAFY
jgi:hypothetical protein